MTVVSPEQIYSYSLQFQQGIRNSLEDVNERVVALIQEHDDNSSASYSESCNKLKQICKEYQRFLQWKNNHQTKLPLDFLFLRKIRDQLCEYKLMCCAITDILMFGYIEFGHDRGWKRADVWYTCIHTHNHFPWQKK